MYLPGTPSKALISVVIEAKNHTVPNVISEKIIICSLFFLVLNDTKLIISNKISEIIPIQSLPKKLLISLKSGEISTILGN